MPKKSTALMRCRDCGFPRLTSLVVKWADNGTIIQLMRKEFRVVILHHSFLENLLSYIETRLGLSIGHIAFEAQRNASIMTFEGFTDKIPLLQTALKAKFARRFGVEFFHKVALMTGMCATETLEYVPGTYGIARIRNPFDINLMAANVVGGFEVLEGVPFTQQWRQEAEDSYIIRVQKAAERPEIAERMTLKPEPLIPWHHRMDRCPRCKVPIALANSIKWIEQDGLIVDSRTGARVVLLDGYMAVTVIREMAAELGEEIIYDLVVEAQKDWTKHNVGELGLSGGDVALSSEELEAAYHDYLELLPLYGYGAPESLKVSDSTVELSVVNPYEPSILAGTLQGLYEALEKGEGKVSWRDLREGVVGFKVEPAG